MSVQLNLFDDIASDLSGKTALLMKDVLQRKIRSTIFKPENSSFAIAKWESGDEKLTIFYIKENTLLGELIIAGTSKGITYLGFISEPDTIALRDLKRRFPDNTIEEGALNWHKIAISRINDPGNETLLSLHLKGTDFQINIWKKLILIPFGGLTNYKQLGNGGQDSRSVGSAVGANPVSYLVPCHRVIRVDGNFNGFFWGDEIKAQLLTYEATYVSG